VGCVCLCFLVHATSGALFPGNLRSKGCGPLAVKADDVLVPPGFCAFTVSSGLRNPRGMKVIERDGGAELLVVERQRARVRSMGLAPTSYEPSWKEVLASNNGLNHGIEAHVAPDGTRYLYASSTNTVYRFEWDEQGSGSNFNMNNVGPPTVVVRGLPSGGHYTRTLRFDAEGKLLVSVGSKGNVDSNSARSRLMRYSVYGVELPLLWSDGEVFADGLRNEVGLAVDGMGRVWGVENGVDNAFRSDLGGDIHTDNPGEELNLFAEPGKFYGYPYCWSEFLLNRRVARGPGTQWTQKEFLDSGRVTDEWCQNPANVVPPVHVSPAHMAPLGIAFFSGSGFPVPADGSSVAFVSFHGSWNRTPRQGYRVDAFDFTQFNRNGGPVESEVFMESSNPSTRPVDVVFGPCPLGTCLFVSDDGVGRVIGIGYSGSD